MIHLCALPTVFLNLKYKHVINYLQLNYSEKKKTKTQKNCSISILFLATWIIDVDSLIAWQIHFFQFYLRHSQGFVRGIFTIF